MSKDFTDSTSEVMEFVQETKKKRKPRTHKPVELARTEHFNMVINENLYADLKALAHMYGTSASSYVHKLITTDIENQAEKLKKYRELTED